LQYFGVDVNTGGVVNTYDAFVWEPALVKLNAIQVRLSLRD
jgi:T-complex protein 1 subunit eta